MTMYFAFLGLVNPAHVVGIKFEVERRILEYRTVAIPSRFPRTNSNKSPLYQYVHVFLLLFSRKEDRLFSRKEDRLSTYDEEVPK